MPKYAPKMWTNMAPPTSIGQFTYTIFNKQAKNIFIEIAHSELILPTILFLTKIFAILRQNDALERSTLGFLFYPLKDKIRYRISANSFLS